MRERNFYKDTDEKIIFPAVIMLVANVFSPNYSSRYEVVTALFGLIAGISLFLWLGLHILSFFLAIGHIQVKIVGDVMHIAFQIFVLSVVAVLSRDYEKILKPDASFFEEKNKDFL